MDIYKDYYKKLEDKKKIKSPCVDKCKYDEYKVCVGCHRTMHEIVNWPDFQDEQKMEIIAKVEKKIKKNL